MARTARRPPVRNAAELHREWLALFDLEGPFLAVPVLKRVWPNGIPHFRTSHPERVEVLNDARRGFETAWEALDREPGDQKRQDAFRVARDQWVETVLRNVVGWGELLEWGTVPGVQAQSPNRVVTVTAQGALRDADRIGALVHVIDPVDSLRQTPNDLWAATPIDRLEALLRGDGVRVGIVTDGRWWGLVHAADGIMTASGVVDSLTWTEEARARDAFFTLVSRQHLFGGDPSEQLPTLFEESVAAAEEITEALGSQVRQAVELLIQSFSESALDARSRGLSDPLPERTHEVYEAAVMMMMRTVFLLFAEERGLLPSGELFEHGYGISGELDRLSRESAQGEESLDATALTWHRLLATSRAIYRGASFENLRMPAYGGSLFDPSRFGFLSATTEQGTLSVRVTDRVMFHVLRSIQVVTVKGEARRISFRDIDVEQIGYIYEGLLGYTCIRADRPILGLIGKAGSEPEIPLEHLETLAAESTNPKKLADAIRDWLKTDQPSADPPTTAALGKALSTAVDPSTVSSLSQAVDGDADLITRINPWLVAIRRDLRGQPFIVRTGGLLVAETPSRRNAGAHYTPKSLAEEVVLHALQPLCYSPGPHQTSDEITWKLRSSDELLGLKVADIACGSGAFLVAAARYLADRVVEAWISEDQRNAQLRDLHGRAVRQVVANCLYGADINEMAVEMCKLSLWLVSLNRDLPFSFVDDKVFHGNSLLGLTTLDQLRKLHIDPNRVPPDRPFGIFEVDIDSIINKAVDLRKRLSSEIDDDDPMRSTAAKHRQLDELKRVTADLRRIADGVIAAGLPLGGKPGRALDEAYNDLRLAMKQAYPDAGENPSPEWLDGLIDRGLTPTVDTDYQRWKPLHWVTEVPDVIVDHGGFDAVIGNPPFLVAKNVSAAIGPEFREWMTTVIAEGRRGKSDMAGYFLLRSVSLAAGSRGNIGLILPKVISEGDTREVTLDGLGDQIEIVRASRSTRWPSLSVTTWIARLWLSLDQVISPRWCDGLLVDRINTSLEPADNLQGDPLELFEGPKAFKGSVLQGDGFLLSAAEAQEMLHDPRNSEVVKRYLNGTLVNSAPGSLYERWVIDFREMSENEARTFTLPWGWVRKNVFQERQGKKYPRMVEEWWKHWNTRIEMYSAIRKSSSVWAIPATSRHAAAVRVPTDAVLSSALVVFASDESWLFGVLSSTVHKVWVAKWCSTMQSDIRYAPSDLWNTFPIGTVDRLSGPAEELLKARSLIMDSRLIGVTEALNLVDSPQCLDRDVLDYRELLKRLDFAVAESYGWAGLLDDESYGFYSYRNVERFWFKPDIRAEVLRRLITENHRRALADVGGAEQGSDRSRRGSAKKAKRSDGMMELFS